MNKKLSEYNFPQDLKNLSEEEMDLLSFEVRDFLIDKLSKTGGHLASNLGVVELTLALHHVFNTPTDKIIWDVGHQSYVHKILTGRSKDFDGLRTFGGMSGFPKREESCHDVFDTGHSSNSISAGMGFAIARDIKGDDYSVISVIGDGSLTGGEAYEGLNNVGSSHSKLIVILNDNEMSISKNTGGMSQHLSKLRSSKTYLNLKKSLKKTVKGIPVVGPSLYGGMEHIRDTIKYAVVQGAIFEELGFNYYGPINGHSMHDLIEVLTMAKTMDEPVLIHVITKKGKGYKNAEINPSKFHGIGPFDKELGTVLKQESQPTYSKVFGNKMIKLAKENTNIVAVCAAMADGTGLNEFAKTYPNRFYDGCIAEAHTVTFAAGLAANGLRPVVAIYSTFLQRAYDQIMIDVAMQNLPVLFAIDRGGIVGADGETHHGLFDLSYLSHMPNMTVLAPKDGGELEAMMDYALTLKGPCAIRYPRGVAEKGSATFTPTCAVVREPEEITIIAIGMMVSVAEKACHILGERGIKCGLINGRMVKPLDLDGLISHIGATKYLVTLEDNVLTGGFGQIFSNALLEKDCLGNKKILNIGWPDQFIEHGSTDALFQKYKLDALGIVERISDFIERKA